MYRQLLTGIDALFITDPLNIRYLTGFVGLAPAERESYVMVTPSELYLFTNALYLEQAKSVASKRTGIEVIETSIQQPLTVKLRELAQSLHLKRIGFEATDVTYAEFTRFTLELSPLALIPTHDRVESLRQIKKAGEINALTQAAKITDACFTAVLSQLKPGVTETEVAWTIETFFRRQGAESAFPPIVAFNVNASQPHYASQQASIGLNPSEGSTLVLLDFGAKYQGYCADMTRTVFLGKPNAEVEKAYIALQGAQRHGIDLLRAGERSGARLDREVRDNLAQSGYPPYPHSLGHAVGLSIHEAPRLSIRNDEVLKPGMVFSVEPGIYVEGSFGLRIEDLVLLTDNGMQILSKTTKEMKIV